jgi:hypothetical protein
MNTILKFIGLLLALILIVVLPLVLLAYDLGHVVYNPPLIKSVITDEVINSNLIPVALEWFSDRRAQERVESGEALTGITEPDIVLLMSYLNRDDWRKIKAEVLTDEILTDWTSVTVDGVYAWIDTDYRVPQITWQLKPFKERVDSEHGITCIKIAYGKLPPCTQAEIDDFETRLAAAPPNTEVLYNLCEFPDPWHEDQYNDYLAELQSIVKNVPDEFALTDELAQTRDIQGVGPEVLKNQLRLIRTLMNLAPFVPAILLLFLLILCVRSLKDLGRWWGLPLLVGGFASLLMPLTYRWLITNFLAAGPLSETPELVREEATRSILRLAAEVFRPMLFQALVVMAVGLLIIAIGAIKARQSKKAS